MSSPTSQVGPLLQELGGGEVHLLGLGILSHAFLQGFWKSFPSVLDS